MLEYLKPLKKRITVGITIKIIGTLAELMIPYLLSYILDHVIKRNDITQIILFGVLMAICAVYACLGNIIANRSRLSAVLPRRGLRAAPSVFLRTFHVMT